MSIYQRGLEKRKASQEYRKEYRMEVEDSYEESGSMSPKGQMEHEKRLRREIANSNERRRMQSINAGFDSLKSIIPHNEGEKLSKAAILQQTAEYVTRLEAEKTRLLTQNSQLKRLLAEMGHSAAAVDSDASSQGSPPPKRKKRDTESSDEGIGLRDSEFEEQNMDEVKRDRQDLRMQLDRERQLRMVLEEETRFLKAQLQYPAERLTPTAPAVVKTEAPVSPPAPHHADKDRFFMERQPAMMEVEPVETKLPSPASSVSSSSISTGRISSMSRRNLETIVEAIRHLEGDSMLFDSKSSDMSSDSEKDCMVSSCEEDDCKSECCASPPHSDSRLVEATLHVEPADVHSQHKYPVAAHLLQTSRPSSSLPPSAFVQQQQPSRQPVIVVNLP